MKIIMVPFSKLKMSTDARNTDFNGSFWMESRETNMLGHFEQYLINIRLNGMLGTRNHTQKNNPFFFLYFFFLFLPHIEPFLMATHSLDCLNKEPWVFTIIILLVILVTKLITHLQERLREEFFNSCSLSTPSHYFQPPWAELECNGFTKQHLVIWPMDYGLCPLFLLLSHNVPTK